MSRNTKPTRKDAMRIGLVVHPFTDKNLQLASQIGVTDIVYCDVNEGDNNARRSFMSIDELMQIRRRIESFGMRLTLLETAMPMDQIILSKPGRDQQIEEFKRALDVMGQAGIEVLCYDWMPTIQEVVRTSFQTKTRGGALTSSFDASIYKNVPLTQEGITTEERMWDDLEYFLKRVIPAAESAQIKLALHPDDPPVSPLAGLARIFTRPESFERLFKLFPSECNGMTFCQGCFSEMGQDVPSLIRKFSSRIHFAHFRDVRLADDGVSFTETFQDDGRTNMLEAMRAYRDIGFKGVIRPDHVPLLATETGVANGYSLQGRLYAVGYMRGLMEAVS
jgi:mannonate dehydratase